jgi:hypothetical protein
MIAGTSRHERLERHSIDHHGQAMFFVRIRGPEIDSCVEARALAFR